MYNEDIEVEATNCGGNCVSGGDSVASFEPE